MSLNYKGLLLERAVTEFEITDNAHSMAARRRAKIIITNLKVETTHNFNFKMIK